MSKARAQQPPPRRWPALWLSVLMFAAAVLASVHFGVRYMSQPGKLPLRVVEINGEFSYLRHAEIEAEVAAVIDGGFFTVDMQKVRSAVRAMPWVDEVSVRRVWPDTLRMHVVEQVPLAYWNEQALVNLRGDVFEPHGLSVQAGLPHLRGEDAQARQVVAFYLRLRSAMVDWPMSVSELEFNPRGEWEVAFDNGLTVMLGRDRADARMADLLRVYPRLLAGIARTPERIDMRYEHGFAVRWQAQETTLQGQPLAGES